MDRENIMYRGAMKFSTAKNLINNLKNASLAMHFFYIKGLNPNG